ncbi:hypothetical protein WAE56_20350 [Iodobacter sp. LRB]|uniref:hypothetical protein n=1 Tax=unclassified Iodobacter TaxID=235634 RepID=UPI0015D5084C|nr:hypothetical protein [Iodobacter sp. BJB302]
MFNLLYSLFGWLFGLWEKLPDSAKEKIIDMIVNAAEAIFREFFRSKKEDPEANNA